MKNPRFYRGVPIFQKMPPIISFVLLGSALLSALLHIPNSRIIWLLGATILSAALYLVYSAPGVSFWSEFVAVNTSALGFSMMFYMLFVAGIITFMLKETKKIGCITTFVLGLTMGIYFLIPVLTHLHFYDMWLPWVITQSGANCVLLLCLAREYVSADIKQRWGYTGMGLLIFAYEVDVVATAGGFWQGGLISKYIFSEKRIGRLMKELGLYVKKNGPRLNSANDRQYQYYPNRLQRNFITKAPNMVWASDITYARVGHDFLYLCVVIDLYARKVVSFSISEYIDKNLVTEAFESAYKSRQCPKALLFHSDQGTQYTAFDFRKKLREYGVTQSFSAPGNPYDNAVIESFFASI